MTPPDALLGLVTQLPNLAGLSILAWVLWRQNTRLMDFQERMIANMTDDVHAIRNDVKRVKDKLNVAD